MTAVVQMYDWFAHTWSRDARVQVDEDRMILGQESRLRERGYQYYSIAQIY